MRKFATSGVFFMVFFLLALNSCEFNPSGDYRTIKIKESLDSGNVPPPPPPPTEEIVQEALEDVVTETLEDLADKLETSGEDEVSAEVKIDGITCSITLRKTGDGYNVKLGRVDLTNEHALKGLLAGIQQGLHEKYIFLDLFDCHGGFFPPLVGEPYVDRSYFKSIILPDTVKDLLHYEVKTISISEREGDITNGDGGVLTFDGYTNLTEIIAHGVTEIRTLAFNGLEELESVDFPQVTKIGMEAFYECKRLKNMNLPNVDEIGLAAFYGCESLESVNFPNVKSLPSDASWGGIFEGCSELSRVDFLLLSEIPAKAFHGCNNLEIVNAPAATVIDSAAFNGCAALTSASFPLVETINYCAFEGCNSLEELNIPAVKEFGHNVFKSTDSTKLTIYMGENPPGFISNGETFDATTDKDVTIKVPSDKAKDEYTNSWSDKDKFIDKLTEPLVIEVGTWVPVPKN